MEIFERYYVTPLKSEFGAFVQVRHNKLYPVYEWGSGLPTMNKLEKIALRATIHKDLEYWAFPIFDDGQTVGLAVLPPAESVAPSIRDEVLKTVAPLLQCSFEQNIRVLEWLERIRLLAPERIDWVGIYYKASWRLQEETTDLVLGPYIGESTEHTRIPIDKGFCGLALSEERTVNVADVREDTRHIACSLKTRSEIVIPLTDGESEFVAELDVDSNTLNAFDEGLSARLHEEAGQFSSF